MKKTRSVRLAEFTRFLNGLGYKPKRTEKALIFHHPSEGLIAFRVYGEHERMDERDLQSTRRFLDLRGLVEKDDFDEFVRKASAPA